MVGRESVGRFNHCPQRQAMATTEYCIWGVDPHWILDVPVRNASTMAKVTVSEPVDAAQDRAQHHPRARPYAQKPFSSKRKGNVGIKCMHAGIKSVY